MGAPGADSDFRRRIVLTLLLVGGYAAAARIPSLGLDTESMPELAERTGLLALGIRPALSAYLVVEFFAWLVPRWQKLRDSKRGRDVLEKQSAILTVILAIFQAFGVVMILDGLNQDLVAQGGTGVALDSPVLVLLSMVLGAGLALALARWITGLGLLNGFVAFSLVETLMTLASERARTFEEVAASAAGLPLIMATAFVLPVAATVLVVAKPKASNVQGGVDIPPPASSLQALAVAGAVLALPSGFFADSLFGSLFSGSSFSTLWAKTGTTLVVGLVLTALLTQPGPLVSLLANTGMRRARATRIARAAAARAVLPAALFVLVLAACEYSARYWLGLQLLPVSLALATALVVDAADALAHRRQGAWALVHRDPRPQLVAVAAEQLTAKGIASRIGTRAQSALLRAFGPYACAEILVQEKDGERAREIVRRLFTGPPEQAPDATSDAAEADTPADADAPADAKTLSSTGSPDAAVQSNVFAPPNADEHEKRPPISKLEMRLAILALAAIIVPALAK